MPCTIRIKEVEFFGLEFEFLNQRKTQKFLSCHARNYRESNVIDVITNIIEDDEGCSFVSMKFPLKKLI